VTLAYTSGRRRALRAVGTRFLAYGTADPGNSHRLLQSPHPTPIDMGSTTLWRFGSERSWQPPTANRSDDPGEYPMPICFLPSSGLLHPARKGHGAESDSWEPNARKLLPRGLVRGFRHRDSFVRENFSAGRRGARLHDRTIGDAPSQPDRIEPVGPPDISPRQSTLALAADRGSPPMTFLRDPYYLAFTAEFPCQRRASHPLRIGSGRGL
jgi:hypothetical protein